MPRLPSGNFVGLDSTPLVELLDNFCEPANVHRVMELVDWPSLARHIEVVRFVPNAHSDGTVSTAPMASSSLPVPDGTVAVRTGLRLDRLDELMRDWPEVDRASMSEFIESRGKPHFEEFLEEARKKQELLLGPDAPPLARAMAHMYRQGVHWVQEKGFEDSDPAWDPYDAIAALGVCVTALKAARGVPDGYRDPLLRADAFLDVARSRVPGLRKAEGDDPRQIASTWRERNVLEETDPESARWIREQAIVECTVLMDAGDELRSMSPRGFGVLALVGLSPEASRLAHPSRGPA